MNTKTDMTVANTISQQIGRWAFYTMGARHLLGGEKSLTFSIRGSRMANKARITLNGHDLYDIEFFKIRGTNVKIGAVAKDIYAEDMKRTIETNTGLNLSL